MIRSNQMKMRRDSSYLSTISFQPILSLFQIYISFKGSTLNDKQMNACRHFLPLSIPSLLVNDQQLHRSM